MRAAALSRVVAVFGAFSLLSALPGSTAGQTLTDALRADLQTYLEQRGSIEHISAASLSVSRAPDQPNIDVAAGTTTYGGKTPVTPANLFQIGSNTKSFTAAAILQLQAQGSVSINDTVGKWLPQYPSWKAISIRELLNMTSGIPTYDDEYSFLSDFAANPYAFWSTQKLVSVIYPKTRFRAGHGWMYSNTAYLMSQMIIEHATHTDYSVQIHRRFIDGGPRLPDTYYHNGIYPSSITQRMVAGYFFSRDPANRGLAPLLGRDVRGMSTSWMQGAGAIVSTPHALTLWVRALYESPMLTDAARQNLLSIVSMKTGTPLATTTMVNSRGFGLGVGQMTLPKLGTFWFYEGETLGYRMIYAYFPRTRLVIALGLNSQPDAKQDKIGSLISRVYRTLASYH